MVAVSWMRCWSPATSISLFRGRAAIQTRRRLTEIRSAFMDDHRISRVYDGLLLDAGGTLLQLARPVEETYASIGRKYGLCTTEAEIKKGFRRAFSAPWPEKLRYQGDGRTFWKLVVSEATGCSDDSYFEEVYEYFANGDAWHLPHGAYDAMYLLKDAGGHISQLSWQLSPILILACTLLNELNVSKLHIKHIISLRKRSYLISNFNKDHISHNINCFDAIIVSSEVGFEKPSPEIFRTALDKIDVDSSRAIHVGDDEKADKGGANSIGIDCWLWGLDVKSFGEITARILKPDSIGETE